jgi:thiamine biosynthesis protein ThiS
MDIEVNGEERQVPEGLTVAGLLEELEVDRRRVAVERNRRVVPREEMADATLAEGDVVEIVQFVGGG